MENEYSDIGSGAFTIRAGVFLAAAKLAARAIAPKPVLPALECLRVDVAGGMLSVCGGDGETWVRVRRGLPECRYSGSFLAYPDMVLDTLKGLDGAILTFTVEASSAEVSWDGGYVSVPVMPVSEWPSAGGDPCEGSAVVHASDLLSAVSMTEHAAARDDIRPALSGSFFEFAGAGGGFSVTSSDARVVASASMPRADAARAFSFVLPRKAAALLKAVFPAGGDVAVACGSRYAVLTDDEAGVEITARLLEGAFPNWRAVVPASRPYEAVVPRVALLDAWRRIGACAPSDGSIDMAFSEGSVDLSARDLGLQIHGVEGVPCDYRGDAPVTISFRASRLESVLDRLPGLRVRFELSGPSTAAVLGDADGPGDGPAPSVMVLAMPTMQGQKEG